MILVSGQRCESLSTNKTGPCNTFKAVASDIVPLGRVVWVEQNADRIPCEAAGKLASKDELLTWLSLLDCRASRMMQC